MHHSPSSLSTSAACERKWYYDHIERRREPEIAWAQIEEWGPEWSKHCSSRQRSGARGTATHALLESYYGGGIPDWTGHIGQIALAMRAHLPSLSEIEGEPRIEESIGEDPYPRPGHPPDDPGEPDRTCLYLTPGGPRFLGYIDLEARITPEGAERLGLDPATWAGGGGWWTFDYKTSKAVDRYAITPAEAVTDPQGVLYSEAGMLRTSTLTRGMRWVYSQTEGKRYAKPVDAVFTREANRVHLVTFEARAAKLERVTCVEDTTPNTDHCGEYGGCPHHVSVGGPCAAVRPIGRKINTMGFRQQYEASRATKASGSGAPPAPEAAAPTPAPAETPAQTAPTTPPSKKTGFGKKSAPAPSGPPVTEAPSEATPAPVTNVTNVNTPPPFPLEGVPSSILAEELLTRFTAIARSETRARDMLVALFSYLPT